MFQVLYSNLSFQNSPNLLRSKIRCPAEHPTCSTCRKRQAKCVYASSINRNANLNPNHVTGISHATFKTAGHDLRTLPLATEGLRENQRLTEDRSGIRFRENAALPVEHNLFSEIDTSLRVDSDSLLGMHLFSPMSEEADLQTNLSWIFDDFPDIIFPSLPVTPKLESGPFPPQTLDVAPPQVITPDTTRSRENLPPDLPMLDSQEILSPVQTMPVDRHTNSTARLVLPPLGGVDEHLPPASYFVLTSITPTTRTKLLDTIRVPLEQGPWEAVSLTNFPSCQKLAHCIDLYFAHFNTVSYVRLMLSTSLNILSIGSSHPTPAHIRPTERATSHPGDGVHWVCLYFP
jgi:hypothetical protein